MGPGKKGLSKKYICQAVEDSLQRLQTDYIDLYQSHDDDPQTPLDETLGTYGELIKQGKIRAIGASNYSAKRFAEAILISEQFGYPRYESIQPLYNLYDRQLFENDLELICLEKQVGVISYYALASGFLTGKYRSEKDLSKSARGNGIKKYLNDRGFKILQALDEVARQYHTVPASVAIAWIRANAAITAPIASATDTEQLDSLIKAIELNLDKSAIDLLNKASE
jgi:aryl-alcohol dehydrogenase-like predicted oxidoreductase